MVKKNLLRCSQWKPKFQIMNRLQSLSLKTFQGKTEMVYLPFFR